MSIIDSGVGISQENIPKLFMNFSKLDEHSQRNRQGTGLGLSISKRIIESMGGRVDVRSVHGRGTEFIINMKTKCKVKQTTYMHNENSQDFSGMPRFAGENRRLMMSRIDFLLFV